MQDLNNLRYFAGIVEHGSLSAAARALGAAKSVVSEHLTRLEAELGLRLIHRTTRRLEVTELGLQYYEHCRAALDAVERARALMDDASGMPRGMLKILCPVNFAQRLLAPLLCGFLRKHAQVEVRLDIGNEGIDPVAGGYDLILRIGPSLPSSGLVSRSFPLCRHLLVASPAFLAEHGHPAEPRELRGLPTLAGSYGGLSNARYQWHLQDANGTVQHVAHTPRLLSEDIIVLRKAALDGIGIADLPPIACEPEIEAGLLVQLLPDWQLPAMQLHALYASRDGLAPVARAFLDHLAGELEPLLQEADAGRITLG